MVPIVSTSYPTLGVIHAFRLAERGQAVITAVYRRSEVWADRHRAKDPFWIGRFGIQPLHRDTCRDLFALLGDELGYEVDQALSEGQRRAQNWCVEHMTLR